MVYFTSDLILSESKLTLKRALTFVYLIACSLKALIRLMQLRDKILLKQVLKS